MARGEATRHAGTVASHGATPDGRTSRPRHGLVVAQITVSALLIVTCGVLLRGSVRLATTDLGLQTRDVIEVRTRNRSNETALATLRAHPLVRMVAAASTSTFGAGQLVIASDADAASAVQVRMPQKLVSPGYFDVYEIGLVSGRHFTEAEASGGAPVVILSQQAAAAPWPGQRAVGRLVRLAPDSRVPDAYTPPSPVVEVIGVARTVFTSRSHQHQQRPAHVRSDERVGIAFHDHAPALVRRRILRGDPGADRVHGRLRLLQGHTLFQPSEPAEPVKVARHVRRFEGQGPPDLSEGAVEHAALRRHADHRMRVVVEQDRPIHDPGIRPELADPQRVAEDHDTVLPELILARRERPSERRFDPEDAKVVGRDARAAQLHRLADVGQRGASAGLRREAVEYRVVALPLEKIERLASPDPVRRDGQRQSGHGGADRRRSVRSAARRVDHLSDRHRLRSNFFGGRNKSPTDRPEHFDHRNSAYSLTRAWLAADDVAAELKLFQAVGGSVSEEQVQVPEPLRARTVGDIRC